MPGCSLLVARERERLPRMVDGLDFYEDLFTPWRDALYVIPHILVADVLDIPPLKFEEGEHLLFGATPLL